MPIFEFACETCDCRFEQLFLKPADPAPGCPKCGGTKVRKLLSAAAVRPHGIPKGSGGFKVPSCVSSSEE